MTERMVVLQAGLGDSGGKTDKDLYKKIRTYKEEIYLHCILEIYRGCQKNA